MRRRSGRRGGGGGKLAPPRPRMPAPPADLLETKEKHFNKSLFLLLQKLWMFRPGLMQQDHSDGGLGAALSSLLGLQSAEGVGGKAEGG